MINKSFFKFRCLKKTIILNYLLLSTIILKVKKKECLFNINSITFVTGDIRALGVVRPLPREIYKPVLKKLRAEGVAREVTKSTFL